MPGILYKQSRAPMTTATGTPDCDARDFLFQDRNTIWFPVTIKLDNSFKNQVLVLPKAHPFQSRHLLLDPRYVPDNFIFPFDDVKVWRDDRIFTLKREPRHNGWFTRGRGRLLDTEVQRLGY